MERKSLHCSETDTRGPRAGADLNSPSLRANFHGTPNHHASILKKEATKVPPSYDTYEIFYQPTYHDGTKNALVAHISKQ